VVAVAWPMRPGPVGKPRRVVAPAVETAILLRILDLDTVRATGSACAVVRSVSGRTVELEREASASYVANGAVNGRTMSVTSQTANAREIIAREDSLDLGGFQDKSVARPKLVH